MLSRDFDRLRHYEMPHSAIIVLKEAAHVVQLVRDVGEVQLKVLVYAENRVFTNIVVLFDREHELGVREGRGTLGVKVKEDLALDIVVD